jgi:short-subunit dehydrogenase
MSSTNPKPLAAVTGASSGIGLELAKQFASNGFDLIIASGSSKLEAARQQLEGLGAVVTAVQVDLAKPEGVETLARRIEEAGRPLDAIAINAGVGVGGDFARQTDLAEELNLIDLNVRSVVHLSKLVVKPMVARGAGKILITASVASAMPGPFEALMAGKDHVVGGSWSNKLQVIMADFLPDPVVAEAHRKLSEPGSGKD